MLTIFNIIGLGPCIIIPGDCLSTNTNQNPSPIVGAYVTIRCFHTLFSNIERLHSFMHTSFNFTQCGDGDD